MSKSIWNQFQSISYDIVKSYTNFYTQVLKNASFWNVIGHNCREVGISTLTRNLIYGHFRGLRKGVNGFYMSQPSYTYFQTSVASISIFRLLVWSTVVLCHCYILYAYFEFFWRCLVMYKTIINLLRSEILS